MFRKLLFGVSFWGLGMIPTTFAVTLDTSFAQSGVLRLEEEGRPLLPMGVATSRDRQSFFVFGNAEQGTSNRARLFLSKFTATAEPDPSFTLEASLQNATPTGYHPLLQRLVERPDGRLYWLIYLQGDLNSGDFRSQLRRLMPDGRLDLTFGQQGKIDLPNTAHELLLDSKGRLLINGTHRAFGLVTVTRYEPDGKVDTSFGDQGSVYEDELYNFGLCLAVDEQDRLLLAAREADLNSDSFMTFRVERFQENGELDLTFGLGGIVRETKAKTYPATIALTTTPSGIALLDFADFREDPNKQDPRHRIFRYDSNGKKVTGFGDAGMVEERGASYTIIGAVYSTGRALISTTTNSKLSTRIRVLDSAGKLIDSADVPYRMRATVLASDNSVLVAFYNGTIQKYQW